MASSAVMVPPHCSANAAAKTCGQLVGVRPSRRRSWRRVRDAEHLAGELRHGRALDRVVVRGARVERLVGVRGGQRRRRVRRRDQQDALGAGDLGGRDAGARAARADDGGDVLLGHEGAAPAAVPPSAEQPSSWWLNSIVVAGDLRRQDALRDLDAVLAVETERLVGAGDDERGADDDRVALGDLEQPNSSAVAVRGRPVASAARPCAGRRRALLGSARSRSPPPLWQAARTSISTTSMALHRMYFCIRFISPPVVCSGHVAHARDPALSKVRGIIAARRTRRAIPDARSCARCRPRLERAVRGILGPGRPAARRCESLLREAFVEVHVRSARLTDLDTAVPPRGARRSGTDPASSATTLTDFLRTLLFVPSATVVVAEARPAGGGHGGPLHPALGAIGSLRRHHRRAGDRAATGAGRRRTADALPTRLVEHLATSARNKGCTRVEVSEPLASAEPSLWKRLRFASRGRTLGRAKSHSTG